MKCIDWPKRGMCLFLPITNFKLQNIYSLSFLWIYNRTKWSSASTSPSDFLLKQLWRIISSRNKFELLGILLLPIFLFSHSMSENEEILEAKEMSQRKTSQAKGERKFRQPEKNNCEWQVQYMFSLCTHCTFKKWSRLLYVVSCCSFASFCRWRFVLLAAACLALLCLAIFSSL